MSVIRALEEIIKTLREDNLEFSRSEELDFQYYAVGLCLSEQTKIKALKRKYVYTNIVKKEMSCIGILKSGVNKGKNCTKKAQYGNYCHLHAIANLKISDEEKKVDVVEKEKTIEKQELKQEVKEVVKEEVKQEVENETKNDTKNDTKVEEKKKESKKEKIKDTDLVIRPNKYKNFIYPGTNLVLDPKDGKAIATEGLDGRWIALEDYDIDKCKKMKIKFKIVDLEFKGQKR